MHRLKITAFAGSLNSNSLNNYALKFATDYLSANHKLITQHIQLSDFEIPMLSNPSQQGIGKDHDVMKLQSIMVQADAILIACPEYNGSVTGALKNAIDWISYNIFSAKDYQQPFAGKVCGIIGASPSPFGAIRGVLHLRDILSHLKAIVMPEYLCLQKIFANNFDEIAINNITSYAENFVKFAQMHSK